MKDEIKDLLRAVPIADKTYTDYIEALADKLITEGYFITEKENEQCLKD